MLKTIDQACEADPNTKRLVEWVNAAKAVYTGWDATPVKKRLSAAVYSERLNELFLENPAVAVAVATLTAGTETKDSPLHEICTSKLTRYKTLNPRNLALA